MTPDGAVAVPDRPWQNDADRAFVTWHPVEAIAMAAGSTALVVLVAVVIWKRGWQIERGDAMGRAIGREVSESMTRHFGERFGWVEVRMTQILVRLDRIGYRLGLRADPYARPPSAEPDTLGEEPRDTTPDDR